MDSSTSHLLLYYFSHYGLWLLFFWLVVGVFIVPIPEEMVMLTVGILISKGTFSFWAYAVAFFGSACGTTFSYFLGRSLGRLIVVKYGKWIGITEKRLEFAEQWYGRYGKWTLSLGYFVPGGRHLFSIVAGTTKFEYKYFSVYAYPVAFFWVALLVSMGYFAGRYWLNVYHSLSDYILYSSLFIVAVFLVFFFIFWLINRKKKK